MGRAPAMAPGLAANRRREKYGKTCSRGVEPDIERFRTASAENDAAQWQLSAGFHCANMPLGLGAHVHTCKS